MTNTEQITIDQNLNQKGLRAMQGYVDTNQLLVRARINERQAEAASERLAAAGRASAGSGTVRRHVGLFLIQAGQRLAGGQTTAGTPATRSTRPTGRMAA